jgi:hypothetical protein
MWHGHLLLVFMTKTYNWICLGGTIICDWFKTKIWGFLKFFTIKMLTHQKFQIEKNGTT